MRDKYDQYGKQTRNHSSFSSGRPKHTSDIPENGDQPSDGDEGHREYQSSLEEDSPSAFEDVLTTRPSYNVSTQKRTVMKGAVVELIGKCLKENEQRCAMGMRKQLLHLQKLDREELPHDANVALPRLETLEFIREARNVVLYGNPGTGKTHLAIGLGIKAANEGCSVMFTTVSKLLTQIREARSELKLRQLESKFEHYDLVICDEFGYVSFDKEGGELLFNHLSLRAGKKSTIITTNLAFNRWDEIIRDKVLCTALVDRITYKAFLIDMTGQSYRLKMTQKMKNKQ